MESTLDAVPPRQPLGTRGAHGQRLSPRPLPSILVLQFLKRNPSQRIGGGAGDAADVQVGLGAPSGNRAEPQRGLGCKSGA